jgi:hypothetical protein
MKCNSSDLPAVRASYRVLDKRLVRTTPCLTFDLRRIC